MTARELLRATANILDEIEGENETEHDDNQHRAAALRALAARWEAEDVRAVRMSENGQVNVLEVFAAKEVREVLARLDSPLVTTADAPAPLRCYTCAPCKGWCGRQCPGPGCGGFHRDTPSGKNAECFCNFNCMLAGRPLHPLTPGTPGT